MLRLRLLLNDFPFRGEPLPPATSESFPPAPPDDWRLWVLRLRSRGDVRLKRGRFLRDELPPRASDAPDLGVGSNDAVVYAVMSLSSSSRSRRASISARRCSLRLRSEYMWGVAAYRERGEGRGR